MQQVSLKIGEVVNGFEVISTNKVKKINQTIYQLKHQATGSSYVHLSNKDTNNCFAVTFLTYPQDSSGIAHILEHLVLCGSKKFPVKDPFFLMLKRSLAVFMNAFTASDWTMYPFCTQNKKDFYNLMDVYTDAAFFPLLKKESFFQEAHRLELENKKIVAKGVVFNEMKGAMSSPSDIMYRRTLQSVFPTITYHHNSGGEPIDILDLELNQLKKFHKTYYHPSNANFFSYGNFPLEKTLKFLEKKIFKGLKSTKSKRPKIVEEKRYKSSQFFEYNYPIANEDDTKNAYQVTLNWLTCQITNSQDILSLSLLEEILLGNSASPIRYILTESEYGKDLADTTGYHSEYSETFFTIGLKGVKKVAINKVTKLIENSLEKLVTKGLDSKLIESAIHQKELEVREISGGRTPYSLNLLFRFVGAWLNQGDIIKALDFDDQIKNIKKLVTKGNYFENFIKKYFINNSHKIKIVLAPDKKYLAKQTKNIDKKIILNSKKDQPIQRANLQKLVNENLDCLPRLKLKEIEIDVLEVKPQNKSNVSQYLQPTNDLEYWGIYLENLTVDFLKNQDIPLISSFITEIGTKNLDYEKFSAQVDLYTGGINFSALYFDRINSETYHQLLCISAKSLNKNKNKMQQLIKEVLFNYDFSNQRRICQLIEKITISKTNSILHQGHSYAEILACRNFSNVAQLEEQQNGIHCLKRLKKLQKIKKTEWKSIIEGYKKDWQKLISSAKVSFFATGDSLKDSPKLLNSFVSDYDLSLNQNWSSFSNKILKIENVKEIWTTASAVSFVVRSYPTVPIKDPDNPKLLILSKLLQANFIHQEIREKGGSYGGIVSFHPNSGIFSFLSYRDPNLHQTWEVYQKAIEWAIDGKFNQEQIEDSILQIFGALDQPLSPAKKAQDSFIKNQTGYSHSKYINYRKKLISVTKQNLISVAEKYFSKQNYNDVAISNTEILKTSKKFLKDYKIYSI